MKNDEDVQVYKTNVWSAGAGCHGGCGQKLYVKDGKLIKIEGDESHPWNQGRACPRVLALTQYMYHPDRITYPLKRVGERGEGKFERISWDEAFDTVESKLKAIREGVAVFPIDKNIEAGKPTVDGPSSIDYRRLNMIPDRTQRYYPHHKQRLPLGR